MENCLTRLLFGFWGAKILIVSSLSHRSSMEGEIVSSSSNKRTNSRSSDSSSSSHASSLNKRLRHDHPRAPSKYKGVVLQSNGNWGAQIYSKNQRIWLGTFKTDYEAATAYFRAAMKLRNEESMLRSVPWTVFYIQERDFQSLHSTEVILDMIRDGSYQSKFFQFVRDSSQGVETRALPETPLGVQRRFLFEKELTPSDVGKLNRLVIQKKNAIKCLPKICEEVNGTVGMANDIEMEFFDRSMKAWRFRYCYWSSSQTFVFTKGWNRFVKEKRLRENDTVVFYSCTRDVSSSGEHTFYMIDIKVAESDSSEGEMISEVANEGQAVTTTQVDLELRLGMSMYENVRNPDAEVATADGEKGVMLFGTLLMN